MHARHHFRLLLVAFFLVAGGATIWILNIEELIRGPWSNILGVIFTVLGIMLGLLQWHAQLVSIALPQEASSSAQQEINLRMDRQKGALMIYTKRQLRGATIHLFRGFDALSAHADLATTIIERRINGHIVFVGIFPALEPGNYKVLIKNTGGRAAHVTVYADQVAEIDWRS